MPLVSKALPSLILKPLTSYIWFKCSKPLYKSRSVLPVSGLVQITEIFGLSISLNCQSAFKYAASGRAKKACDIV